MSRRLGRWSGREVVLGNVEEKLKSQSRKGVAPRYWPTSEMRHGGKGKGGDGVTFKCVARPPHAEVCCALAHVVLE